jgi:hypothetical protein
MNCISGSILLICLFTCTACGAPASETESGKAASQYGVHYTIKPDPADGSVEVEMTVGQTRGQLRELAFDLSDARTSGIEGGGELHIEENGVRWLPNRDGGNLRWRTRVSQQRRDNGYDALLDSHWGIFRAEDIIPRARTRTLKGARSKTSMAFELPANWSAVSEYSTLSSQIEVSNAHRRFDQPRGWIAMGHLGIRRETIAGTRIAIVAPEGQDVRRMDMLALLNWVLPELSSVLPDSIPRLTVVSAGDPMWRGGLSAPSSIFIHASRPLISENATSTLVHELVHVAMGISAESGFDWIVEGLAEYYSLELLQRGGAITARRFQRALERQSEWAASATSLCGQRSSGAGTALAVVTFRELDREIREKSAGQFSLDNLLVQLTGMDSNISLGTIEAIVAKLLNGPSETLAVDKLPGCRQNSPIPEA